MKNILIPLSLIIGLSLSGCASFNFQRPPTNVVVSAAPPVVAPKADPLVLKNIQWKVYNSTELKALSDQLQKTDGKVVLFVLDEDNFKALNDNLVSIKGYIEQQNAIIVFLGKEANAPANAASSDVNVKK